MALIILAVVVIAGMGMVFANGKNGYESMSASILKGSNPVTVSLNVTVSGLEYSNQPNQWFFNPGMSATPSEQITKSGDWVLNNSGYKIFMNNSSASAQSSPSIAEFNIGQNLSSNVSYIFEGSRFALNGTGTFYLVLSASSQTGLPSTVNETGSSSEAVYLKAVYSSGVYDLSMVYWPTSGVVTTQALTGTLAPLQFYTAEFNIQSSGTQLTIMQLGAKVAQSTEVTSNISALLNSDLQTTENFYSSYEFLSGTGGKNSSMILNYAYLVDHNYYNYPASAPYYEAAPAMEAVNTLATPFDPSVSNGTYIQNTNSADYGNFISSPSVNLNQFSNVTSQNSTSSLHANYLNSTYIVSNLSKTGSMNATQAYATASSSPQIDQSVNAQIQVNSFNSANVATQLQSFLQNYASAKFANAGSDVPASQVTVLNYVITEMGLNMDFNNATANDMRNYFYNNYASDLQASNLSLVNITTNAVVAGFAVGSFYDGGMVSPAVINARGIVDPFTGQAYSTLALAGFPAGSYITTASFMTPATVLVPQLKLMGYTSAGDPIFSESGFSLSSITGALTSAGTAVQSFFHTAVSNVGNSVNTLASTASNAVKTVVSKVTAPINDMIRPITSGVINTATALRNDLSTLHTTVGRTISNIAPIIGGTTQNLSKAISSSIAGITAKISQVTAPVSNVASDIVSSVATGVNNVKTDLTDIGTRISANMDPSHIVNSINTVVNDSKAVLSPLFTSVKTLGSTVVSDLGNVTGSIARTVTNSLKTGMGSLDTVGQNVEKLSTGAVNTVTNALGSAKTAIVNAGGKVVKGASSVWNAISSFGAGIKNNIVTYLAITGGIVIVIVVLYVLVGMKSEEARGVVSGARKE